MAREAPQSPAATVGLAAQEAGRRSRAYREGGLGAWRLAPAGSRPPASGCVSLDDLPNEKKRIQAQLERRGQPWAATATAPADSRCRVLFDFACKHGATRRSRKRRG